MRFKIIYKNFLVVLITDILLLTISIYAAYLIRFDFGIPQTYMSLFKRTIIFILIFKIIIFYLFDLYRGMWRYTSISDLLNIIKASSLSSLIVVSFILFGTRFEGFSRSVFIIDWCFTILLISGFRLSVRFYFEHIDRDESGIGIKSDS
jgi:FlaA1/EpsC-like NDP-sugar epimerase